MGIFILSEVPPRLASWCESMGTTAVGFCRSFQSRAITEFNYANQVQLNDSSNNRLSAELGLFMGESCLSKHLVVTATRAHHS